MIICAKLQSSRVRHQYGIFGGKSQTSFTRNATRVGSEEGRLFSQATSEIESTLKEGPKSTLPAHVLTCSSHVSLTVPVYWP